MSTALLDARPRIRPDVLLGPGLLHGAGVVHTLKDRRTGRYLRVGPREHFVIARLDGTRTLADVGEEYLAHFDRRLDEARWRQILTTLAERHLLAGGDPPHVLDDLADATRRASRQNRTLLKARLPLVDPRRFLGWLAPRAGMLFSRRFVVAAVVAEVLVVGLVLTRLPELVQQLWAARPTPAGIAVVLGLFWLSVAAHEVAHGLVCTRFGGTATEIGIMWRFPVLAPYCDADDVVLMDNRWHRVLTASAGVFTSLLSVVPFAAVWLVAPPGALSNVAAAMLLLGGAGGIANLVPVFRFDGYFMLNHALGMQNLRAESYRYVVTRLRGGPAATTAYSAPLRRIYLAYATASLGAGTAAAIALAWWVFTILRPAVGAGRGAATVAGLALCGLGAALAVARRRRAAPA